MYSPANIARVKQDEISAAENEAETKRRTDKEIARRRINLLRGTNVDHTTDHETISGQGRITNYNIESGSKREGINESEYLIRDLLHNERKQQRRRRGENDTDRDIRLAEQKQRKTSERSFNSVTYEDRRRNETKKKNDDYEPLTLYDPRGHISLFSEVSKSEDSRSSNQINRDDTGFRKIKRPATVSRNKDGQSITKVGSSDFEGTCLIAARADKHGVIKSPWYYSYEGTDNDKQKFCHNHCRDIKSEQEPELFQQLKTSSRSASDFANDPLSIMRAAQVHLKKAKRKRI